MTFMLILYILICFLLIFLVMIQNGSAFGSPGGASNIFFGSSADTVVTRLTSLVAFCFIFGTMCLSVLSSDKSSVIELEAKQILERISEQKKSGSSLETNEAKSSSEKKVLKKGKEKELKKENQSKDKEIQ